MQNIKEFYIFGGYYPIDTQIGKCHFVKVKDYPIFMEFLNVAFIEKEEVIENLKQYYSIEQIEIIKNESYISIIREFPTLGLYEGYKKLFNFCFKEDTFDLIKTDDELTYYIKLIKEINCVSYEKKKYNPNPEIAYYEKLEEIAKSQNYEPLTLEAIVSSVYLYRDPFELTIYNLYKIFNRIGHFKNYETTTLFKTITDKVDINSWCKDDNAKKETVELEEQDKQFIGNRLGQIKDNSIK